MMMMMMIIIIIIIIIIIMIYFRSSYRWFEAASPEGLSFLELVKLVSYLASYTCGYKDACVLGYKAV
jgi:hypothetical protein